MADKRFRRQNGSAAGGTSPPQTGSASTARSSTDPPSREQGGLVTRMWAYQRERFPVGSYVALVAALTLGTLGYVMLDSGAGFGWAGAVVGSLTALGIFWQLRVADEYKDAVIDARYRPYRPVPRGLVTLRELAWIALAVALLQLALNWWLDWRLILFLLATWGYLLLMRKEFFIHDWLVARPVVYLFSHMVIMIWLFLYLVAVGVLTQVDAGGPGSEFGVNWSDFPAGLVWFLLAGMANGIVFEIARKVRAPEDEESGVETYSGLWGPARASMAWWLALAVAGGALSVAGWQATDGHFLAGLVRALLLVGLTVVLLLVGLWYAVVYARQPSSRAAKRIDRFSALWVLVLYSLLFALPWMPWLR